MSAAADPNLAWLSSPNEARPPESSARTRGHRANPDV